MNKFMSYVVPIDEIPTNSKLLRKVGLRPTVSLLILAAMAIVMLIPNFLALRVFAIVILLAVVFFISRPNKKVADIFDDFIVVYNEKYPDECQVIYWETIEEWAFDAQTAGMNTLTIHLDTDEYVSLFVYTPLGLTKYFNQKVFDKERRRKRLKEAGASKAPVKASMKLLWRTIMNKGDK